ncbi:MAG: hypothetical protein U0990_09070 [Candidatus Nanopelagicales bacterium]|nr:hypothetical protein [Candidatus Nanopelagicales bacterium]
MANQTPVSSLIGANLSATTTTQLFALGTRLEATDGTVWQFVQATGTFTTGYLVNINPTGTAFALTSALLQSPGVQGVDIGVAQGVISEDEYGWVATKGRNLYVLCTGTCTGGAQVAVGAGTGRLQNAEAAGVSATMQGIYITTSASTATASVAVATLTWPRSIAVGNLG